MEGFDVVVIGAGFGGASVAALLAHQGFRVALVEKTARAGGKTQTTERKGYRFEMFGAVGIPAHNSRFHELVDRLGIADRTPFVVPEGDVASIRYKTPDGDWRVMYSPLMATGSEKELQDLKDTFDVNDDDVAALGQMYGAILTLSEEEIDSLDDTGMLTWMRQFKLPAALESQVCMNLNTLFVVAVDRLAASEAIRTLRDQLLGGAGRYHIGGYGRVAEVCAEFVVEQGGAYFPKTRVDDILVDAGRAVGVACSAGEIRARAVISSAGIQATVLKLAGPALFPADYVERVKALEPSWGIAGFQAGQWPDVPVIAIDVPSEFDPGLSDIPGHQLANCQVFSSADPESPMAEEAMRRCEQVIDELWPDLKHHVIRKEPYGARQISSMSRDSVLPGCGGEAVGVAQVVGQCGGSKPDARTPLPGLYLVGCDAGGRGAGTHQAVDSGFNVAEIVKADLQGAQARI
jgi:prolycopene isomerase